MPDQRSSGAAISVRAHTWFLTPAAMAGAALSRPTEW